MADGGSLAALVLALTGAAAWGGWRGGRRRTALNRAMHELRRPLQGLFLASQLPSGRRPAMLPSSLALVSSALADLDREINREPAIRLSPVRPTAPTTAAGAPDASCLSIVRAAEARWRHRAEVAGGSMDLRWRAGRDFHVGAPERIAQALDNLIDNAVEHGGGRVTVDVSRGERGVRIAVCDRGAGPDAKPRSPASVLARLTGRRRRGHGLAVVREVAAATGGRFILRPSPWGTRAVLEVPVADQLAARPG
jgi:signal transduction histidine kinase